MTHFSRSRDPRVRWHVRCGGLLALAVLLGACDTQQAVAWADDAAVASNAPSPLAHPPVVPIDSTMRDGAPEAEFQRASDLLRDAGAATLLRQALEGMPESRDSIASGVALPTMSMAAAPLTSLGAGDAPLDSARCVRSLRVVQAPGRGVVAVWWSRRTGGRVHLVAAWRDSISAERRLGVWRGPIVIDTVDQGPADARAQERGALGCVRPPPSVVVDDVLGYVHVAYAEVGPEGPGVFYAHQMDPRAAFESPMAIVYGEQLGAARVAAMGNLVAVAYEDPNSGARPRVGLAISRTAGHLFEDRLIASGASSIARDPHVLVRGRAVVEGWSELPVGGGEPIFRLRRARVR
jgi:hypothetical protein